MKYTKKISAAIFILIFLLNFTASMNVHIASADIYEGALNQMIALSRTSGYSSDGEPAAEIEEIVAHIIEYALSFLGVIFIILIIYSGFLWMTASGDSEKITKAKGILINAIIGIAIVLSAFVITATVLNRLGAAMGT